jgi:hypothetical protein
MTSVVNKFGASLTDSRVVICLQYRPRYVTLQTVASLIDDARIVIYDSNVYKTGHWQGCFE